MSKASQMIFPEFEFLCCVSGPRPHYERGMSIVRAGLDWNKLANLAEVHGMRPQLLHALRPQFWEWVPMDIKQRLEIFRRCRLIRNLELTQELLLITSALAQKGIPYATFKGLTLALLIYGDLSQREFNDIDILVRGEDLRKSEEVLEACGYQARGGARQYREAFLSYQRQYTFVDATSRVWIDLHWEFVGMDIPFPIYASEVWTNLQNTMISGRAIPTLGDNDLAIYLAGHGAKEGWKSLGWICDFAQFIHQRRDIDWDALYLRAKDNRCGLPILLAHMLASMVFSVTVAPQLLRRGSEDAAIVEKAQRIYNRLMYQAFRPLSEELLAGLELCESGSQKFRVLRNLISTRTTGDYEAMPLPSSLWRLYHLTRPFRLAFKGLPLR